jgi:hypothetical protein
MGGGRVTGYRVPGRKGFDWVFRIHVAMLAVTVFGFFASGVIGQFSGAGSPNWIGIPAVFAALVAILSGILLWFEAFMLIAVNARGLGPGVTIVFVALCLFAGIIGAYLVHFRFRKE